MQDTIRAILRAATEEGSWEDALDRICFEVGAPASALFMSDDLELKSKSAVYSAFWRDPAREDIRSRFDGELDVSADAPAYGLFKTLPHLALVPEIDIFRSVGIAELPPSEIRDLTFSYGFRSRVVSVLNTTGPWMDVLTFQTDSGELDPSAYLALSSTLASAMRMRHMLRDARKNSVIAREALNRMPIGVSALDHEGRIMLANHEAERQFQEVEQINNRTGRVSILGLSDKLMSDGVEASWLLLDDRTIEKLSKHAFVLANSADEMPLIGQIEPISELYESAHWLLFIFDLRRLSDDNGVLLGQLAGLTAAETDVLRLLSQGNAVRDIAAIRGTSRITIRNQLKSIMEKLRCSSQRDLVALSASTSMARLETNQRPS